MNHATVIEITQRWISSMVIGLNLCPFARRVFEGQFIRYVVTEATDEEALLADLERELKLLVASPIAEVETTLLIHPHALGNFLDYNDFLDAADDLIADLRMEGVIQIASFHPSYWFTGTSPDAVENYTNRSPFPMLHLLREESVSRVAGNAEELDEIPRRNVETLRMMGRGEILEKLKAIGRADQNHQ
jgi:uncharacterized protein